MFIYSSALAVRYSAASSGKKYVCPVPDAAADIVKPLTSKVEKLGCPQFDTDHVPTTAQVGSARIVVGN